jgi:LysM repeat protein
MPREIVYPLPLPETKAGLGYQTIIGIIILVIVLIGGALLALLWPTLTQSASPVVSVPTTTHTPEPTASETSIPATETPTRTATSTRTATPTLVPTATPQVVQLPLESILGTEYTVVLHRVIPGDSLTVLAQNYGTSDKAILDATYRLIMPLFVDRIIVIPYQIKNWKDLPPLEPYQISRPQTTLDEIAAEFGIDPALLKYHNGCENCVITEGSWIVLPRSR